MTEIYEGTISFKGERGYKLQGRRLFLFDGDYIFTGAFSNLRGTSRYTFKIRQGNGILSSTYKCITPTEEIDDSFKVHTLDFLKDGVVITGEWPESGEVFEFKAELSLKQTVEIPDDYLS